MRHMCSWSELPADPLCELFLDLAELANHTSPLHACTNGVCHGRANRRDVCSSRWPAGSNASCDVTQDAIEGVRRVRPGRSLYGVGASGLFARLDAGGDAPHPGRVAPVQRSSTDGTEPPCRHVSGKFIGPELAGRTSPCGFRKSSPGAKEAGKIQAERLGCEGTCEPVAQDGLTATRQAEAETTQQDRSQPQGVQKASKCAAEKKPSFALT